MGNKANLVTEIHDFKDEKRIYRKHKREKKSNQKNEEENEAKKCDEVAQWFRKIRVLSQKREMEM